MVLWLVYKYSTLVLSTKKAVVDVFFVEDYM